MWEVIIAGLSFLGVMTRLSQGICKYLSEPANRQNIQSCDGYALNEKIFITMVNDGFHETIFCLSVCSGLTYWFLQANTGYFALYLFFCQMMNQILVQTLKKEMNKNNHDNAESVKNHICAFQALQQKYEKLMAKNSKLEKEHTTLQQNHDKLIAESNKLVNETKPLHSDVKVKSPSKLKVRSDKVSPRTVDINLSGPCQEPLSALCASFKEEDDDLTSEDEYSGSENSRTSNKDDDAASEVEYSSSENSCSRNNDESTDSDDSYPPRASDDQDIDDNTHGYQAREFLTFYVGNLHYSANSYQVRKAVEKAVGFHKIVDQVVIAKTSTGESRGCAFVTVRWRDFVQIEYNRQHEDLKTHTSSYDEFLQEFFNFSGERICGRQVICEVAWSQRRD